MFANARSRLLPMSLPFRYFAAAAAFQLVAWLILLARAGDFIGFQGGLGPTFAALHVITLGVVAMCAIGATLQLFPVATRQPVRSLGAARLVWWLLVPAVAAFAYGGTAYRPDILGISALGLVIGFSLYGWLLYHNLRGARGMPVVVAHGWAAIAGLALTLVLGLALAAGFMHGFVLDYQAMRNAHLVAALFGFMGLLALGLSNLLLPMLAIAPPPRPRIALLTLSAAIVAIALAALGFRNAGLVLGLAAALTHVVTMERAFARRLRPPLGSAFMLIRVSWACLVAGLAVALAGGPLLVVGVLLVPGWLLTFLLGVLQRIAPFLASVHASRGAPLISELTPRRLLAVHGVLHVGALVALLGAALSSAPWLAHLAAALGLAGAAAFAAFLVFVIVKVRTYGIPPPHQPAPA
jgi:hypothetical protein